MKSDFQILAGKLLVRIASTETEVNRAIDLRTRAFRPGAPALSDRDAFDRDSEHLIVIDPKTDQILGNYRLRSSLRNETFYSETEFDLSAFDFALQHVLFYEAVLQRCYKQFWLMEQPNLLAQSYGKLVFLQLIKNWERL